MLQKICLQFTRVTIYVCNDSKMYEYDISYVLSLDNKSDMAYKFTNGIPS